MYNNDAFLRLKAFDRAIGFIESMDDIKLVIESAREIHSFLVEGLKAEEEKLDLKRKKIEELARNEYQHIPQGSSFVGFVKEPR